MSIFFRLLFSEMVADKTKGISNPALTVDVTVNVDSPEKSQPM